MALLSVDDWMAVLLLADDQQPFPNFARENGFTVPKCT